MDGLRELLREREDTIVDRWFQDTLAVYPGGAVAAFSRERDRFANPIGHSLRTGTRALFEALLDDPDGEAVGHALDEILSIRAVQQMPASQAVGFLFRLKDLLRDALDGTAAGADLAPGLRELDRRIDRAALRAFETYVAYRELVCELRINELKRTMPWGMGRVKQG